MKSAILIVCRCGAIRKMGNWTFIRTSVSTFIQHAIKFEAEHIELQIITCPSCLKNQAKNGQKEMFV